MKRRFLFMRHGESTANVQGICAGGDTVHPLTETGRTQARAAAEVLRRNGLQPGNIVHSCQARALETATLAGVALRIAPERITCDANWRERGFGEWEGVQFTDIHPHLEAWIDPPAGETLTELFDRVTVGLASLPDGLTLVVSHGGIWHVLNKLHGIDPAPHIGNAEVFEVMVDDLRTSFIQSKQIF